MTKGVLCLCVALFVSSVYSQTVKRPEVPAQAVDDNEMNFIIESCRRLIAENDTVTHFVSVPSDCSAFAICEHPALGVIPALMNCPAGMFFDDGPDPDVLTCKRAGSVACLNAVDPCSGKTDGFNPDMVRSQPTQAAYYMCQNQRAMYGDWCELGEQYGSVDVSCVPIPNFVPPETTTAAAFACDLQPMADKPDHFMQEGYVMPCAPGTVFSFADCNCVHNTL